MTSLNTYLDCWCNNSKVCSAVFQDLANEYSSSTIWTVTSILYSLFSTYYCTCIRSSLDYACPVFHDSLPKYLKVELESVQRRALSCIFPRVHFTSDALQLAGLESIRAHQENLTEDLFKSIVNDPRSKITSLLSPLGSISYELRKQRRFATPLVRTNRFGNSFIVKSARKAFK